MGSGYLIYHGVKKDYLPFKSIVDRSITEVTAEMLDGLTSIGDYAFQSCNSLKSVNIPSGVTSIGNYAFSNCSSLTNVTIPSGVISVGDYAFRTCELLTIVNIPSSVMSIGTNAFRTCTLLTSFTVNAIIPPTLGTSAFNFTHANLIIYVPEESVDTYKAASGWSTYASKIQAIT